MDNEIHLLGYAPKDGNKARKTIAFDKRYPAEVFNSDDYIQVLILPDNGATNSKDFLISSEGFLRGEVAFFGGFSFSCNRNP